ncbi:MAG: hypothetical protein SGJ27_07135 [Candidatus Melainabacteria bacterium]|nr:hypothetical protein [Candidatus Melainabacteria bacterium]
MLGRLSAGLVIALVSITTASDASAATTTTTKSKVQTTTATHKLSASVTKHQTKPRRISYRHRGKSYLVPPPPPYAPSILPELAYARHHRGAKHVVQQQPEKVESRYTKLGVQSAEGYEDPEPVKANKYVTYWNKS